MDQDQGQMRVIGSWGVIKEKEFDSASNFELWRKNDEEGTIETEPHLKD